MATRAIVTHQPEVECDVCGRRLLRGERPDTFLASGHARTVCELCVPRATHVGWMRASEADAEGSAIGRGRAGRSLIGRLRQLRNQAEEHAERAGLGEEPSPQRRRKRTGDGDTYDREWTGGQPFDLEDDDEHLYSGAYAGAHGVAPAGEEGAEHRIAPEAEEALEDAELQAVDAGDARLQPFDREPQDFDGEPAAEAHASAPASDEVLDALESFNASEYATRIAGIARALGAPSVNVTPGEKVLVTVAWELCWYRYEVDLRSDPVTIGLAAEGMELDELPEHDRLANASANERGELSLL